MYFLATGTITQPDQIGPHMQEETRVLNELRELGLVREAFRKTAGPGVIGILQAASLDEARAQMGMLPFVALARVSDDHAAWQGVSPGRKGFPGLPAPMT